MPAWMVTIFHSMMHGCTYNFLSQQGTKLCAFLFYLFVENKLYNGKERRKYMVRRSSHKMKAKKQNNIKKQNREKDRALRGFPEVQPRMNLQKGMSVQMASKVLSLLAKNSEFVFCSAFCCLHSAPNIPEVQQR